MAVLALLATPVVMLAMIILLERVELWADDRIDEHDAVPDGRAPRPPVVVVPGSPPARAVRPALVVSARPPTS